MSTTPVAMPRSMTIRDARASSVIAHRVPPGSVDSFMEWQRGVTSATAAFGGYVSTDVYPPADPKLLEWVIVVQFDRPESLRAWLDSPQRAEWTGKLPKEVADYKLKTLPSGFGPWFAGLVGSDDVAPPGWKMALTVLLGLYPLVMLLTLYIGPHTASLGMAVSMLIGNALSVALLQWVVVPPLSALLAPWLKAKGSHQRALSLAGVVLVLLALAGITLLFRRITG